MSVLISVQEISKSYGARTLFQNITFSIETGQKIALVGPNGTGKSTLLSLLCGTQTPDSGKIVKRQGLTVGYLSQKFNFDENQTLLNFLTDSNDNEISTAYEWISKLSISDHYDPETVKIGSLSGGWKKRLALAKEIMKSPDLLVLDEPTNHLDIDTIQWLEDFIASQNCTILIVTHDRLFLQNTSEMIFDLNPKYPQGLLVTKGSYAQYLESREILFSGLQATEETKRNVLRREVEWLRRGAKARQTKQKARIERAEDLSLEVKDLKVRNQHRVVSMDFEVENQVPRKIIEAKNVSKSFGDKIIFKNLTTLIGRGSRIGLIGKNGSGKSTLLKTLIGETDQTSGSLFINPEVKISYFEQTKEKLDLQQTVIQTICPFGDYVHLNGKPIYAKSYLERFLFRPQQMIMPVAQLSGGEQSRLVMAQMMLNSGEMLILDEPTNDLDVDTLDVLQNCLTEFPGAVMLVTHDRFFMDQVVDEIWSIDEQTFEIQKFANYFQWEAWYKNKDKQIQQIQSGTQSSTTKQKKQKISFKEQLEFDQMESKIETIETEIKKLEAELSDSSIQSDFQKLNELTAKLEEKKSLLEKTYERWQDLSAKVNG